MTTDTIYQKRLSTILARIEADPACWDQAAWHCGTAHCLAGHAQLDAVAGECNMSVSQVARSWLGMSHAVANWAFDSARSLPDLRSLLEFDLSSDLDPDGFDRDGRTTYGFDRNGIDRDGYDVKGFHLGGIDRDGFDYYGYDRNGARRLDEV
jgi:hypothetical protein